MQTTAIRTVANSLPQNEVILLTLLISKRYIPNTDLHKISRIALQNKEWFNNNPIEKHSHIVPYAPVTNNRQHASFSLQYLHSYIHIPCDVSRNLTVIYIATLTAQPHDDGIQVGNSDDVLPSIPRM